MDFKYILIFLMTSHLLVSQNQISGFIFSEENKNKLSEVEVYDENNLLTKSDKNGYYKINTNKNKIKLTFFNYKYKIIDTLIILKKETNINISLKPISIILDDITLSFKDSLRYNLIRLPDYNETSIYSGKKNEVIVINNTSGSKAINVARQLYSKIAGLNIYQNDDAGIQLNIGGRGLDPKRSANFNTRQNGYDISADVLGYPESYYTPPAESLEKVQIIRGASSLQYGTQFGGLVNFILKKPDTTKNIKINTRNTLGSNNLFTNFTSISYSLKDFSSYSFLNLKTGDGFRENSEFNSLNLYNYLRYKKNDFTASAEITYLKYLAQQGGGLSDVMFDTDPYQSNRERNWFQVKWLLYNLKFLKEFSKNINVTLSIFGLNAERSALGFRSNRVNQVDPNEERDLIVGEFKNYGFESKILHKYKIINKKNILLLGSKIYISNNISRQGPGSNSSEPDFNFDINNYPYYVNQSNYKYPNINRSIFVENIFYVNKYFSIIPGFRYEYINTKSNGYYKQINLDGANNVIFDTTINNSMTNEREFILTGVGCSYKLDNHNELYTNATQNYRSVTFSDISIINPSYIINPDISDENGFTIDFGFRGNNKIVSYDITSFLIKYNNRIGFIQRKLDDGNVKAERNNIGDAIIYGYESLIDLNINELIKNNLFKFNLFINSSITESEYIRSEENGVVGNSVEFIPKLNLKTGIKYFNENFTIQIQYTLMTKQFTDATNAIESNLSGVIGEIPQYDILDLSSTFQYKRFRIETGVNNLLNKAYYTRRATGYPGPGIIPSPGINLYLTIEIEI